MIDRKKKLRLIQFLLLFFGISIIYLTYYDKEIKPKEELVSQKIQKKTKEGISEDRDLFFNIEYSGLDLQGNRYLIKSEEAYVDELYPEIIYMRNVNSIFSPVSILYSFGSP